MNRKTLFLLAALAVSFAFVLPKEKKYKVIFYKSIPSIQTDDYQITFSDMHSQDDFILVRAEIRNLSGDYLTIERSEIRFSYNGVDQNLGPKKWLIKPFGKKRLAIKSAPMPELPAEKAVFKIDGFSRIPVKGALPDLEAYPLPDTKKVMTSPNVKIRLTRLLKKTKVTECTFSIMNLSKDVILHDRSRITATAEGNDNQWPTDGESKGYRVLWPGKETDIHVAFSIPGKIVDMQFANMLVHWNESLMISKLEAFEAIERDLEMDLGKTEGSN